MTNIAASHAFTLSDAAAPRWLRWGRGGAFN